MTPEHLQHLLAVAGIASALLNEPGGTALVTTPSARVIGLWPAGAQENVLWTHPEFPGRKDAHGGWAGFNSGGLGGDRLWLGPEHHFFWNGAPRPDLSNWRVLPAIDGGDYRLKREAGYIEFTQRASLPWTGTNTLDVSVARRFVLTSPPCALPAGVGCVALREERRIQLHTEQPGAEVDGWSVAQVPVGAWILIPVRGNPEPFVAYESKPGLVARSLRRDHGLIFWHITGKPGIKASLPVETVTGRIAVVRPDGVGRFTLLVKSFLPAPGLPYRDGLLPAQVGAQCVQWWDGNGFGELEVHSPTVTPADPVQTDNTLIWTFAGSMADIRALAETLLNCSVPAEVFAP